MSEPRRFTCRICGHYLGKYAGASFYLEIPCRKCKTVNVIDHEEERVIVDLDRIKPIPVRQATKAASR